MVTLDTHVAKILVTLIRGVPGLTISESTTRFNCERGNDNNGPETITKTIQPPVTCIHQ